MLKPLTAWVTTNWKILKEMGMPDHLTCPRNLYAGQEAIVRTRHGAMDWFQTGKGVCQGYAMRETEVRFLGREDPLEKEMAVHSSTLAWKIPWMEEPDRLQSMGSQRVGHD